MIGSGLREPKDEPALINTKWFDRATASVSRGLRWEGIEVFRLRDLRNDSRPCSLGTKGFDSQAQLWAYVDDFRYLAPLCALCIPIAFFCKKLDPGAKACWLENIDLLAGAKSECDK
jgi:hypothetical protein